MTDDRFEYYAGEKESILSTRLPDETFRGLINLVKAYQTRIPKNEIEKALVSDTQTHLKTKKIKRLIFFFAFHTQEYLYDDVPTEC